MKEADANEHHKNFHSVLRAEALTWAFEQLNFEVGNRGSVVGSDFYTKLKKIEVPEEQDNSLYMKHTYVKRTIG